MLVLQKQAQKPAPEKVEKPAPRRWLRFDKGRNPLVRLAIFTRGRNDAVTEDRYAVEACDEVDTYLVTKSAPLGDRGYEAPYRVCITAGREYCQCKGFEFSKTTPRTCRHVAALLTLRQKGAI